MIIYIFCGFEIVTQLPDKVKGPSSHLLSMLVSTKRDQRWELRTSGDTAKNYTDGRCDSCSQAARSMTRRLGVAPYIVAFSMEHCGKTFLASFGLSLRALKLELESFLWKSTPKESIGAILKVQNTTEHPECGLSRCNFYGNCFLELF
jgi:hypothetical protein